MPDKKNNNKKKGGNRGAHSLTSRLVSAARKRQREEGADNERDPAGPAGQHAPTTTTTAAPGSNASTSLVPNVPDVMHLTRNHVQANISRRGNILGLSNTDFFVTDGLIHACSRHNLTSHTPKDCNAANKWDRQTWWTHLVYNRSGLPPLAAHDPWEELAYDYIFDFNADKHGQLGIEDRTSTVAKFREWYDAPTIKEEQE
ncbi:hypothetical protein PGQ11_001510 [Apiospora arundinis]|uniref:Uncharacterized protein n=1 Tax=Apiospora arundinis TaxID=335852 RepID=A0ABR2JNB0_9PEZI